MERTIAYALLALVLPLAECGGGGCDAGKPAFENQKHNCADTPLPPASAASR